MLQRQREKDGSGNGNGNNMYLHDPHSSELSKLKNLNNTKQLDLLFKREGIHIYNCFCPCLSLRLHAVVQSH